MAGSSKDCDPLTSESKETNVADEDMSHLDYIDKLLVKDSSEKLQFLEFERQMFLDAVYNDALVICAK